MKGIETVAVEFELTPEDWEDVNAVHLFDSSLQRRALGRSRVAIGLLFATLAALMALLGFGMGAVVFGAGALAMPALMGPMHEHAQRRALRKMAEEGISVGTFGRHRIEVRSDGLFHATHAYETLLRWHAIQEVKSRDGHFLVYFGPNAFLPIPDTAFPNAETLRRFADAFYERVGPRRGNVEGAADHRLEAGVPRS